MQAKAAAQKTTVSKDGASSMALSKARMEQEAKEREAKLVRTSPSIFKKDPETKFEFDYYFDDLKMLDDVSYCIELDYAYGHRRT